VALIAKREPGKIAAKRDLYTLKGKPVPAQVQRR
jgi:hypothetical protein